MILYELKKLQSHFPSIFIFKKIVLIILVSEFKFFFKKLLNLLINSTY